MSWSNNNVAHRRTDYVLVALKQYNPPDFEKAGKVAIKKLKFFPGAGASNNIKKTAAMSMASMIDGFINQVFKPKYEPGFNPTKAIKLIALQLADGEKTVADLGDAIDEAFFFRQELQNA
jgi:hypothetical protein